MKAEVSGLGELRIEPLGRHKGCGENTVGCMQTRILSGESPNEASGKY